MGSLEAWISISDLVTILIVILTAVIGRFLLVRLVRGVTSRSMTRARQRREQGEVRAGTTLSVDALADDERHRQRTATLGSLISSLISVTIWVIALLTILAVVGVPLGPLLTSAGVGGVALAFGAQGLVKDLLSGVFMIMEDQYGVGDLIDTTGVVGTVEEVGLRVTRLRDSSGTIWYVRNGEIPRIGNRSQGWSTAVVDVPVAVDEDPGRAIAVLEQVAAEMEADHSYAQVLLERPCVAGVEEISTSAMTIRLTAKTSPNEHLSVQRALLERAQQALTKAGVRIPAPSGGP